MIITITGIPGAGKSTIATLLSEKLTIPWYSIGQLRGKMAKARGITIDELNVLGEEQDFTDKEVDAYQEQLGKTEDNFIMDGRLSWHFIPNSFKLFLDVNRDEAARRIFEASKQGLRDDEKPYENPTEVRRTLDARLASDQKRYQQYYNLDYLDTSNYDLVIDTTDKKPQEILQMILDSLDTSLANDVS